MSAIWGAVSMNQQGIAGGINDVMEVPFHQYRIDRFTSIQEEQLVMGCAMQFITKENETEELPFYHTEQQIYLTADCFLDNREELLGAMEIETTHDMTDSQIILSAYLKWGEDCFQRLLGVFSFVLYDQKKSVTYCVTDFAASRCLYYYVDQNTFYFSTLLNPLRDIMGLHKEWNERWIVDFLAQDNLKIATENRETYIKGIYKLEPAQYLKISGHNVERHTYWKNSNSSSKRRRDFCKSDQEYRAQFREILTKSTSSCIRTDQESGILLSGGLDSSVVAGASAPLLRERDNQLYSFTSVPLPGYQSDCDARYNTNERAIVEKTAEFLGNVECSFIDMEGISLWEYTEKLVEGIEVPYKAVQNLAWIHASLEQARVKGCRIMLNGQFGNATVSFGNRMEYYISLLYHFRWIKLKREIHDFAKICGSSRKYIYKLLGKVVFHNVFDRFDARGDTVNTYLSQEMRQKWEVDKRFRKEKILHNTNQLTTLEHTQAYCYYADSLAQIGEAETKLSLMTGVLVRDPTRDRRLIEFCSRLPADQFVHNQYDRRLINDYCSDIIAPEILQFSARCKGLQSADMRYRLGMEWPRLHETIQQILEREMAERYIKQQEVLQALPKNAAELMQREDFDVIRLLYQVLLLYFLQSS